MTDYIKRKTALEDFERCNAENPNWTPQRVKTLLLRQPAADVAEVVQGQWEETDWREYDARSCETIRYQKAAIVCTNCRCAFKKDALWKRYFCPNCVAKIDGGCEDA